MKITVFGASGQTGKHVVHQALKAGHEVIAFVRNPSRFTIQHESLRIIQGDTNDPAAVEKAICGTNIVVSVLSTQKDARSKPLTQGMKNILAAMERQGVRRLICSAPGVPVPGDSPDFRFKLQMGFVKRIVPLCYKDSVSSVEVVTASGIDWTIVRMTRPSNMPMTGHVGAGYVSNKVGMGISRADAAAFILNEALESEYIRQIPVIYSMKK